MLVFWSQCREHLIAFNFSFLFIFRLRITLRSKLFLKRYLDLFFTLFQYRNLICEIYRFVSFTISLYFGIKNALWTVAVENSFTASSLHTYAELVGVRATPFLPDTRFIAVHFVSLPCSLFSVIPNMKPYPISIQISLHLQTIFCYFVISILIYFLLNPCFMISLWKFLFLSSLSYVTVNNCKKK